MCGLPDVSEGDLGVKRAFLVRSHIVVQQWVLLAFAVTSSEAPFMVAFARVSKHSSAGFRIDSYIENRPAGITFDQQLNDVRATQQVRGV